MSNDPLSQEVALSEANKQLTKRESYAEYKQEREPDLGAVVLNGSQLNAIHSDPRYKRHWMVQSLLLTLADTEQRLAEKLDMAQAQRMALAAQVKWFEATYGERAMAPVVTEQHKGSKCPQCGEAEAAHIGAYWCCFACSALWEQPAA